MQYVCISICQCNAILYVVLHCDATQHVATPCVVLRRAALCSVVLCLVLCRVGLDWVVLCWVVLYCIGGSLAYIIALCCVAVCCIT